MKSTWTGWNLASGHAGWWITKPSRWPTVKLQKTGVSGVIFRISTLFSNWKIDLILYSLFLWIYSSSVLFNSQCNLILLFVHTTESWSGGSVEAPSCFSEHSSWLLLFQTTKAWTHSSGADIKKTKQNWKLKKPSTPTLRFYNASECNLLLLYCSPRRPAAANRWKILHCWMARGNYIQGNKPDASHSLGAKQDGGAFGLSGRNFTKAKDDLKELVMLFGHVNNNREGEKKQHQLKYLWFFHQV